MTVKGVVLWLWREVSIVFRRYRFFLLLPAILGWYGFWFGVVGVQGWFRWVVWLCNPMTLYFSYLLFWKRRDALVSAWYMWDAFWVIRRARKKELKELKKAEDELLR